MKILILCTGNSCRSQMAHGFLQSFDDRLHVFSAGTEPATQVNRKAVQVMKESGIDISNHSPEKVDIYLNYEWNYVITVCDNANETCPVFIGKVKHRLHMGYKDPTYATGTDEQIINQYRSVRDEIKTDFYNLYTNQLKSKL